MNAAVGIAETDQATRLRQAVVLLRGGRADEALSLLRGLQGSEDGPELRRTLAEAYDRAGYRHCARLLWLDLARRGAGDDLRHHRNLGRDALERRDHREAERHFLALLAAAPGDLAAAEELLEARLGAAAGEALAATYARHLEEWPETANALSLLATAGMTAWPRDKVLDVLGRARAAWGGSLPTALRIAEGFRRTGSMDAAIEMLDTAAAHHPNEPSLLRARLAAQRAAGAPKAELLRTATRLVASEPDRPDHHVALARLHARFKDWAPAAAAWQRALDLDRDDVEHWRGLLTALGRLERNAAIESLLREARAHFARGGSAAVVKLAVIESVGGYHMRAAALAASAVGNPQTRAWAREVAASALLESGEVARAWGYLSAGLDDAASSVEMRRMAARCAAVLRLPTSSEVPRFPDALFQRALLGEPPAPPRDDGPVILVTSSLSAGGAERQVALTAAGIARLRAVRGGATLLVGQDLSPERGRAVMRPLAETAELSIEDLGPLDAPTLLRSIAAADPAAREALRLITAFPPRLSRDVLKLYDLFRRHRPGLVHLWQDGVISTGSVAAALAGVPKVVASLRNVVATEADRRRYRPYLRTMYRALARRGGAHFTANSAAGALDYERWLSFAPGRISVIRNGIEVETVRRRGAAAARAAAREALGLTEADLLVGGTFRLAPAKRPQLWLSVAERVAASVARARFVIVGEGALRQELEAWIAARGLSDRITLAGRKSPVEPWIAAMDVMLLASEVEGLPNVLLEAQALGVPVVTTNAGGSAEAVLNGITGLLVEDDEVPHLAAAIVRLLTDDGMRARARLGAPVFIEGRFGVDRMVGDTLALYGSVFPTPEDGG
ncbi:glycosyltransferase [Roseomonas sp. CCTCC AB2023176]|uniref:glycosyltransferase n=1 Tax=Roseomonas sp. CCTCC AB2023176 TaxID=3342640 RepID=UPI0035DE7DCD